MEQETGIMDQSRTQGGGPFVFWTFRRTGGTTLSQLLMTMGPGKGYHEPFNHDRDFGFVGQEWQSTKDRDLMRANIARALDDLPLIKHCYELLGNPINRTLMGELQSRDYRHVILDRRGEVNRLLSLELARLTGAWGKMGADKIYGLYESGEAKMAPFDIDGMIKHMGRCHEHRSFLERMMRKHGITPHVVYFEDLYVDHAVGHQEVEALVDFLGIDRSGVEDYEGRVSAALTLKGQNSRSMMDFVPNIAEARRRLDEAHEAFEFLF